MTSLINASTGLKGMADGAYLWVGNMDQALDGVAHCSAFQRAYMMSQVAAAALAKAKELVETYDLGGALGEVLDT